MVRSRLRVLVPALLVPLACDGAAGDRRSEFSAAGASGGEEGPTPSFGATPPVETSCAERSWAPPRRVDALSTPLEEGGPALTANELAIVFHVRVPEANGARYEMWTATRAARTDAFSAPQRLPSAGSDADDAYPALVPDGVTLLFASRRLDRDGPFRLFRAERPDVVTSFSEPSTIVLPEASAAIGAGSAVYPFVTPDRTRLYFSADRDGDGFYRLYRSDVGETGDFGAPVRDESVDDAASSLAFVLSADRLSLFVSRRGVGGYGVHTASRANAEEPFGALSPVAALDAGSADTRMGWLSLDGCRAYLTRRSGGGEAENADIYVSERGP